MLKRIQLSLLALLLCCESLLLAQGAPTPTNLWPAIPVPSESDATSLKIINLHLKARGGIPNMENIENVRLHGITVEGLVDHSLIVTRARPNSIHLQKYRYHLGYDHTAITATNGKQAWQRITQPKMGLPNRIGGKTATQLIFEAKLPFIFLNIEDSGNVFSYHGEKDFAGRTAYVIHAWLKGGMQIDVFFDSRSFQIINYRHPQVIGSAEVLVDRMPTGLKKENRVWWESGYTLQHGGKIFKTFEYETVETNVDLDEGFFEMPEIKEFWLRPEE